jgi:DNA-binding response OmpR family regulator
MRLLLVEDEPDLGSLLHRTLRREKYLVDWVQDGLTAWRYLEQDWVQYQLAIFDWLLPGLSGIELCQRLRQRNQSIPVLILTAKDQMEDLVQGLDAGADDYMVKPFHNAELLARLRALQRRSDLPQLHAVQVGPLILDYGNSSVLAIDPTGKQQLVALTANEFRLLEYFMRHPNQTLTRDQLLSQLWATDAEPISNVVSARIRLLRRKLADYGCAGMIETVHGFGYRLVDAIDTR